MREIRSRALVLRSFDHGESDRIVTLFSEVLGRVSAIAKGARRSRRRFPGVLETFSIIDARLADPPRSSLLRLEEARLLRPFEGVVNDLGRYAIACQCVEILARFTGEQEANPGLYRFVVGALEVLEQEPADRLLALLAQAKMLAYLGFRPQLVRCTLCDADLVAAGSGVGFAARHGGAICPECPADDALPVGASLLLELERGIRTPLRERGVLALGPAEIAQAELCLDRFVRFHVGVELRSIAFLREILPLEAPQVRLDAAAGGRDTAPARGALAGQGS